MKPTLFHYLLAGSLALLPWAVSADTSLSNFVQYSGEALADAAGNAVATGDINNDGYVDSIIAANGNDDAGSTAGAVYLVYGQSSSLSSASLSSSSVVQFIGEATGDNAGYSVATGDVNNDGYDDILVGAKGNNDGGAGAGAVYLIYGQETQYSDTLYLSNYVEFTGEAAGDNAGYSVATGDVNNDGYDDILVGATGNDDGGTNAGAVYLIYGQSGSLSSTSLPSSSLVQFTGAAASDYAGYSLSTGDVNNDGYDDILVGAYGSNWRGRFYLIYGQASIFFTTDLAFQPTFRGEANSDYAGYSLSTGDVNNDGYDDILVGAYGNDDGGSGAGAVYLIYGQSTVYSDTLYLSDYVEFTGEAAGDNAGYAVTTGDMNDDGYDDILIGAKGNDDGGSSAGAVYLMYGQSSNLSSVSLTDANDVEFTGEATYDYAGYSVATGDINNDGYDDVVIGATGNDDGGSAAGAAFVGYLSIDADHDGVAGTAGLLGSGSDCNDSDATVSSNQTYYLDSDGDGLGISTTSTTQCSATAPTGYVANSSDANDSDYDNDGSSSSDDCNDNDATVFNRYTYYRDYDNDGLGSSVATTIACSPTAPSGYVVNSSDTDDLVASGDSDNDDDGVAVGTDCNDADSSISSSQTYYRDADGDGYGSSTVTTSVCLTSAPTGYVTNSTDTNDSDYDNDGTNTVSDCNDADSTISSNQTYYQDADGDGYGNPSLTTSVCSNTAPAGYVDNALDTDDTDSTVTYVDISSVAGTSDGDIIITYEDDSTAQYDVFTVTTTKPTVVARVPNTTLVVTVHPRARKIALVDGLTGEVYVIKPLNSTAHSKIKLRIKDLRSDNKYEAIVVSKRKTKLVHVHLFSIKATQHKLKKRAVTHVRAENILPSKTRVKNRAVVLRTNRSKTVVRYAVTKAYRLKLVE